MSTDTPANDLVVRLQAAIDEVEKVARAASGDWEREGPATGEHWQWVRSGHYDPLCDQPVDLDVEEPADEFIADGNPVSLRSVERYPTTSVGPLPHFVVNGEGETARAPARHIVLHDPAAVLRLCQSHRDLIELHAGAHECRVMVEGVYPPDWDPTWPYGAPGEKWRHASAEYFEDGQPCPTIISVARGYGVED